MAERGINWETAEVNDDGTLTVGLTGENESGWNQSFDWILEPLMRESRGGVWGRVVLSGDKIVVHDVGGDDSVKPLQDFLESVVRQANSDLAHRKVEHEQSKKARDQQKAQKAVQAEGLTDKFRTPPE